MNNKLIDRGAVMIDYLERLGRADSYKAKFEALAAAVDNAPAVGAGFVRYACWNGKRGDYTCSACGAEAPNDGYNAAPYCYECGAKMVDAEVQDEDN